MPESDPSFSREPNYLDEVEELIGRKLLSDSELDQLLKDEGINTVPFAELDLRGAVYFGGLRLLATRRHEMRRASAPKGRNELPRTPKQIQDFNKRFENGLNKTQIGVIKFQNPEYVDYLVRYAEWADNQEHEAPSFADDPVEDGTGYAPETQADTTAEETGYYQSFEEDESAEDGSQEWADGTGGTHAQENYYYEEDEGDAGDSDDGEAAYQELTFEVTEYEDGAAVDHPESPEVTEEKEPEPQPSVLSVEAELPNILAGLVTHSADKSLSRTSDEQAVPDDADRNDIYADLYEHQIPYMDGVIDFIDSKSQTIMVTDDQGYPRKHVIKGAIVVSPTGSGKTVLMAKTALAAGVGQSKPNGQKERVLIVTPSRLLCDQIAGITGDDTFRRFAPGLNVAIRDSRNAKYPLPRDAEVVVTTIEQFVLRTTFDGKFCGQDFGLLLIDEAHLLTEPQFRRTYLEKWHIPGNIKRPKPVIGFTARSAYNSEKDAAKLLPHVIKHADTISYMEQGILGAGQFFTILAEPEYDIISGNLTNLTAVDKETARGLRNEALMQSAYDITIPLLRQGRRGIIFCESGDFANNAIELASRLNGVRVAGSDKEIVAKPLHSYSSRKEAQDLINAYHAGEVDVLTSVGMGSQGLNADFNFVGICGNVNSVQKFGQVIGRGFGSGLRASEEFPTTTFYHVLAGHLGRYAKSVTFAELFDTDIEQGAIIGKGSGLASKRISRLRADKEGLLRPDDFPEPVKLAINKINMRTVQEIDTLMNRRVEIPTDYIPFDTIYEPICDQVNPASAKQRLDRAGYEWHGKLIEDELGNRSLMRYYEPSAATFFTKNPIAPHATENMKNIRQTARHFDVADSFVMSLAERMEKTTPYRGQLRLNERGRTFTYFDEDALEWMKQEIENIGVISEGDMTLPQMAADLGVDESVITSRRKGRDDMEPAYKALPNRRGFRQVFSPAQVKIMEGIVNAHPWATDNDWSLPKIAKEAGITNTRVHKFLTDEDKAATVTLRTRTNGGGVRELEHLPEATAKAIIERIREHKKANDHPAAAPDEWSLPRMSKEAGQDSRIVTRFITDEDKSSAVKRRPEVKGKLQKATDHYPEEVAKAIIERIKSDGTPLPAHVLPYPIVAKITGVNKNNIPPAFRPRAVRMRLPLKSRGWFLPWADVQLAGNEYGRTDLHPDIEWDRLPTTEEVALDFSIDSPETQKALTKIVYARSIQLRFMDAKDAGNPDGVID